MSAAPLPNLPTTDRHASSRWRRALTVSASCALLTTTVSLGAAGAATAGSVTATSVAARSTPTSTPVTTTTNIHHGVKPIHPVFSVAPSAANKLFLHSATTLGAVAVHPKVYVVFWGNQWSSDPAAAAPALKAFFRGLHGSADTWGTDFSQYCGGLSVGTKTCGTAGTHIVHPTSSILAGAWFDNASAAPSNATGTQLANEAIKAAKHFGNLTQASNSNTQYVIASAAGTHPDGFPNTGFCAWHDFTSSSVGNIAYTNLPYLPDLGAGGCTTISSPTLLDGYFSTETHEYAESVTDLWPSKGWLDASGNENGDLCVQLDGRLTLPTGTFDVQGVWSNAAGRCVTKG